MTDEQIEKIALANGFKLKEQPDGSMALNPYVFEFARAMYRAGTVDEISDWTPEHQRKAEEMLGRRK